jgi:hypothetical protein
VLFANPKSIIGSITLVSVPKNQKQIANFNGFHNFVPKKMLREKKIRLSRAAAVVHPLKSQSAEILDEIAIWANLMHAISEFRNYKMISITAL